MLVDARLVREGVLADDGLVGLDLDAGVARDHLAGAHDLLRVDRAVHGEVLRPRAQRHHDLLQRGVARALAQRVEGNLHLHRQSEAS